MILSLTHLSSEAEDSDIFLLLGHVIPRTHCSYFSELLLSLNRVFPAEWRIWLSEVLAVEGFPSAHATPQSKSRFYMQVTK